MPRSPLARFALCAGLTVGSAVALALAAPSAARACSCMKPRPPQESLERADAVFEAVIIGEPATVDHTKTFTFEIKRQWKGDLSNRVDVSTASNSAACGRNYKPDTAYLIYAYRSDDGGLRDGLCSRTRTIADAAEDLDALGPAVGDAEPEPDPETPDIEPPRVDDPPPLPDADPGPPPAAPNKRGCSVAGGAESPHGVAGSALWLVAVAIRRRRARRPRP